MQGHIQLHFNVARAASDPHFLFLGVHGVFPDPAEGASRYIHTDSRPIGRSQTYRFVFRATRQPIGIPMPLRSRGKILKI